MHVIHFKQNQGDIWPMSETSSLEGTLLQTGQSGSELSCKGSSHSCSGELAVKTALAQELGPMLHSIVRMALTSLCKGVSQSLEDRTGYYFV